MPGVPANGIYGTSAIRRRKHRHGLTSLMQGSETSSRKPADRGRPTYTWTRAALINYTRTIGSRAVSRSKIEPGLSIGGGSGPAGHLAHQTAAQGSMRIRLQAKRLCPVRAAQCAPAARLAADQCISRGADRSAARTEPSRRNKTIPKIRGGPRRSLAECYAGILDRSPASSERRSMFAPHACAVLMVATWVM